MASTPIASVIMAVYNGSEFISRAITSVLNQTEPNFELIIVNDGSSDKTTEIIKKFPDHRIKLYETKNNNGISQARNIGLAHSTGDIIFILDSDDEMLPRRIEKQIEFMQKHDHIQLCGSHVEKNIDGKIVPMHYKNDDGTIKARLLALNGSSFINSSTCMRRRFMEINFLNYPGTRTDEDHALWINFVKCGATFGSCEEFLTRYYRHKKNITTANNQKHHDVLNNKRSLRKEIILTYFPILTATQSYALADLMNPIFRHSRKTINDGLTTIWKCYEEKTSLFGENKNECFNILAKYENAALSALKS